MQYSIEQGQLNALDLNHQMRKLQKANRTSHTYKLGEGDVKDTFATLEIADENQQAAAGTGESTEFTGNASLRQLVCLLPTDG